MVAGHLDVLAFGQLAYDGALHTHQPPAEAERRPAARRVAHTCKFELRVNDLLRQGAAFLAGVIVIDHGDDRLAEVALAASQGRQGFVHENQRQAGLAQRVLHLHRIGRVVGAGETIPSRDEDMSDAQIGARDAEEGVEAGPLKLIAFDPIIKKQVAVLKTSVPNHRLNVFRRTGEGDAKAGGLALCPAHEFAGGVLVFAAGVSGIEKTAADGGSFGHEALRVGVRPLCL